MNRESISKAAPTGKFRVVVTDYFDGWTQYVKGDHSSLDDAKAEADEEDCVWASAMVYNDNGVMVYKTKTADLE